MKNIFVNILLATCFSTICQAQNPPITPAWAFGHIVWEDNINTTEGAEKVVSGYLERGIPVDGVIIDSPWSTGYCDFVWDSARYSNPEKMIRWFADRGVKVILWTTGNVNETSSDAPAQKCRTYDEMKELGYGVNNSTPYKWWKGSGMHLDFTNPDAVQWWYKQMDEVFVDGVYGWKVDQGENTLGLEVETSVGTIGKKEFAKYYYDRMFEYAVSRKAEGITIARPYSHQGGFAASVSKLNLGWCGDFHGDWTGMKEQVYNVYRSSQAGYSSIATEIGGFQGPGSTGEQLIRYAQFGAMTACMINGGTNGAFTSHLPWYHGEKETEAYAFCVGLHEQLRPYLFSTVVDVHLSGGSLMKECNFDEESHKVGRNIFTKAITSDGGTANYHLPSDGEWVDFWTGKNFLPGSYMEETYELDRFPLFFRKGSITPLSITNGCTAIGNESMAGSVILLVFPNGKTNQLLHLPDGDGIEYSDCLVSYDEKTRVISIQSDKTRDYTVIIKGGKKDRTVLLSGNEISRKV